MSNTLDYLVVYGDSYSDIHQGSKRTNGPLWSEQLASKWNTELVSYAKPGATFCQNSKANSSWLKKQAEQDTTLQETEKSSVHVIFLGITDLIETQGEAKDISKWVQCIKDQVLFLNTKNPNSRILIMGVPALEFSPYAITHKSTTTNLKQNIIDFNVALEEEVLEWRNEASDQIEFFDTYLVFSDLLGDPSVANIDNVDDAYWDKCQGKCLQDMDSYLWWDSIHVTGSGHKAISNTIQSKEFFNLKSTSESDSQSSTLDDFTGLSQNYTRFISWLILLGILGMILYMFRHNRVIVSIKKTIQTKAAKIYPSSTPQRNNHDYTLV
ncbi:hypothetical protein INT46_004380 [Mucor plumbeus]|uniref:Carbohydrate esterase family 16 protein n=1 Tax=Mucor plumbeus TaxID=97098 RepID=A0A8H7QFE2_9FUNG|nr:hypothetical protein INT46_004380 [Mucor plumbeus]